MHLEVESRLAVPLHVGGGYGGDPDWTHGVWKGAGFAERRTYDLTDPNVAGRVMFGVVDHVGRATCSDKHGDAEGFGLFEHGALGRHDPSGFTDWFTLAPSQGAPHDHLLDRDAFFIDGGWAAPASASLIEVVSPHTEEVVATVPEGTPADIDAAVAAARHAFDDGPWPRLSPQERIDVVQAFSGLYAGRLEEMAEPHHHRDGLADVVLEPRAEPGAVDADRGVPRRSRGSSRGRRSGPACSGRRCWSGTSRWAWWRRSRRGTSRSSRSCRSWRRRCSPAARWS